MSTELLERPDVDTTDDSPDVAHIVLGKAKVAEAAVLGTPVEALCGAVFVPQRDPKSLPLCEKCKEVADRGGWETEGLS